jgi:5-methylcytosine-specific restriction protein A
MRITQLQIEAACHIASQVYAKKLTTTEGANLLANQYSLNITSARDFIYDYKQMMYGRVFHRAMSASAMEYFLSEIHVEHGKDALSLAIEAVQLHIEYFESHYKITLHKMRKVVEKIQQNIPVEVDLAIYLSEFNNSVEKSMIDSPSDRLARLKQPSTVPKKARAYVAIFVRNPDVVAEILLRAKGTCEGCGSYAPFVRKKDGTPYLEVHHKKKLSDGGADSIMNAIALCPNCHRERHFGEIAS